nr:hypothetical protein [Tanacetum cinerariifolium]
MGFDSSKGQSGLLVWFHACIPRHAFNMWLILKQRFRTQDCLRSWEVNSDLAVVCPLCETQSDSHEHLFFDCTFSQKVWSRLQQIVGLTCAGPSLASIIMHLLIAKRKSSKSCIGKLVVAATAYFIWHERFFFLKFDSIKGLEDVLESGPWMIRNSLIILKKWTMNTSPYKEELTFISVWVKIHDVPLQVFSNDGISLIASQIESITIPNVVMNNDGFQTMVNKRKSGKTGSTIVNTGWQPIKPNEKPTKAANITSSSYTHSSAKKRGLQANVTTIEEAKDLATLPLHDLIDNLKVYEMILENDGVASKTTKEKVKSLALKAKVTREQTSDDNDSVAIDLVMVPIDSKEAVEMVLETKEDDQKKQLEKNNDAKMTLYNALPCKEYERVFMCKTDKEVWYTLIITHQGNSQVKDCKIDLLIQQYEKILILSVAIDLVMVPIDSKEAVEMVLETKEVKAQDKGKVATICSEESCFIGECPKHKENKAFVGRSWSDSQDGDEP